jgi:hypothetical protein
MPRHTATWQYVYGIIPTDDRAIFEVDGLDPADEVHTVVVGDLAVVTSGVDRDSLQGLERATAMRFLSAHQRVLEMVMHDYPVLPVKFGTLLPDECMLQNLIRQGDQLLHTTLSTFAGKQQSEIVVLWDLQKVFQEISAEAPIATLRNQIAGRAPDETVSERVALGQLVHATLQHRRGQISEQVIAQLRDLADDVIINPSMDDSMVVNVALLLDESRQNELDERMEAIDAQFAGQFQIRCVGPLPPYSFATLEVKALPFEAVDAARQQLGLGEDVSASAIKRAYRQMATQAHPDRNSNVEHSVLHMEALTAAYHLLNALAKAQAPAACEESDWPCFLSRAAVERTLLLNVVRQESANM